jgi:predicted transcriptional regulator
LSDRFAGFNIPLVKDTTVSFKLEKSLKAKLVALAKAENRSLSNLIEKVLKEEVARSESKPSRGKT